MSNRLIVSIISFTFLFSSLMASKTEDYFPSFENETAPHELISDSLLESWWWPWGSNEEDAGKDKKGRNPFTVEKLSGLKKSLKDQIAGQDQAISLTVSALERYAYGLNDPQGPIASLLYIGPTGVGKTQLARELGRILLGSEHNLLRFNMAEYSHESGTYALLGAPRGYYLHHLGGHLTEGLKQNPYAIVLLDEIDKAHPDVLKIFLQIFDEGFITDTFGNLIDCRNMLFILTTNLEAQKILTLHDLGRSDQEMLAEIRPNLMNRLSPELYNRLEPVIFRGFKENILDELILKLLSQATDEIKNKKDIHLEFDASIIEFLKTHAHEYQLGARPFKQLIKKTISTALTEAIIQNYLHNDDHVLVTCQESNFFIQNTNASAPFIWHWKNDKAGLQPPFKFEDLLNLETKLQQKVLGQPYPIKLTVAALMRYAAGLTNQTSPIGAFLYVGPTGVGKTQLAKELSIELLGGEEHLIRLDMSEYIEQHSITRLIGSPPGYVHHDEGGQLTEALKKNPYAIVLLDEIEKAHPAVLKLFLQIFDEGRVSDSKGEVIDCRNVIFIATTNLGAAKILKMHQAGYTEDEIMEVIHSDISQKISPELYNRLEAAPFMGLSPELLDQLVHGQLKKVQESLRKTKKIDVQFDASLIEFLKLRGYDYEYGARPLKRLIEQTVVTSIAKEIIAGTISSGDVIILSYDHEKVVIKRASP